MWGSKLSQVIYSPPSLLVLTSHPLRCEFSFSLSGTFLG